MGKFTCPVCSKNFEIRTYLKHHLQKFHSRTIRRDPNKNNNFCGKIGEQTTSTTMPTKQDLPEDLSFVQNCALCEFSGTAKTVFEHLEDDHGMSLVTKEFQFDNYDEFCDWKEQYEIDTQSYFGKSIGICKKQKGQKRYFFRCHRTRRSTNTQTINQLCPASIRVTETIDAVTVKIIETHLGHVDGIFEHKATTKMAFESLNVDETDTESDANEQQQPPPPSSRDLLRTNFDEATDSLNIVQNYDICARRVQIDNDSESSTTPDDTEDENPTFSKLIEPEHCYAHSPLMLDKPLIRSQRPNIEKAVTILLKNEIAHNFDLIRNRCKTNEQLKYFNDQLKEINGKIFAMNSTHEIFGD